MDRWVESTVVNVPCGECTITVFIVRGQGILIESRHHGRRHTTKLSAVELRELLDKAETAVVR